MPLFWCLIFAELLLPEGDGVLRDSIFDRTLKVRSFADNAERCIGGKDVMTLTFSCAACEYEVK